jgi:hypothetical protein
MDAGAKSLWVDKTWFLGVGGTMKKFYGPGATGADGRSLPVSGSGVLPWFKVWGCEFDGLEVRVMDHRPSKIPVGVQFWMKYGLQLDLSKQCARIRVDGVDYAGPVLPIRRRSYVNERYVRWRKRSQLRKRSIRWI